MRCRRLIYAVEFEGGGLLLDGGRSALVEASHPALEKETTFSDRSLLVSLNHALELLAECQHVFAHMSSMTKISTHIWTLKSCILNMLANDMWVGVT